MLGYPAFVVKIEHWLADKRKVGTGVLLNAWQVATCWHVVDRGLGARQRSAELADVVQVGGQDPDLGRAWSTDGLTHESWANRELDLAVLQLTTPAPVEQFPSFVRNLTKEALETYFRHGYLFGFRGDTSEPGLLRWNRTDVTIPNESLVTGVPRVSVLQINGQGAAAGFSGGGALVRSGERALCIGLARFGGDEASFTKLTGSDEVLRALADAITVLPPKSGGVPLPNDARLGFAVVDIAVRKEFDPATQVYLAQLHERHTTLDWTGLGRKHGLAARVDVEDLYQERFASRGPGEADYDQQEAVSPRSESLALVHALKVARESGRRGLLLLGHPGMGKTTYLKSLLLAVLRNGSESVGLRGGLLPVFIPLEELSHQEEQHDEKQKMDTASERSRRRQAFTELAVTYLRETHAVGDAFCRTLMDVLGPDAGPTQADWPRLFLLDGLDQVSNERQRAEVAQWITEQLQRNPSSVFVVTCRSAGYRELLRDKGPMASGELPPQLFLELELQPLASPQAEQFVHRWYESVARDEPPPGEAEPLSWAAARAAQLWETLNSGEFRTTRLAELAGNPLLLTATCVVHRKNRELPRERGMLYEACVEVLTECWRDLSRLHALDPDDVKRLLQVVAYWMHQQPGRERSAESELAAVLQRHLVSLGAALDGAAFLQGVNNDSGLLTGYSKSSYGFLHLAFQEYLCAKELLTPAFSLGSWWPGSAKRAQNQRVQALAATCGDAWWQEVGALYAGMADRQQFTELMEALLVNPNLPEPRYEGWLQRLDPGPGWTNGPFIRLLAQRPGTDEQLWRRQLVALRYLLQRERECLSPLRRQLRDHPYEPIRALVLPASGEALLSPVGDYELVWLEGGTFTMGSPSGEKGHMEHEGPQHEVTLKGFFMGTHPVTNAQYGQFLAANPAIEPPRFWRDREFNQPAQPVVGVSWNDANRCAEWMGLRLPTEAEWEYACRAESKTRFWSGDDDADLERVGWVSSNSGRALHAVGEKPPNPWGLYDMHGNVFEWCSDALRTYRNRPETNPVGKGLHRVLRGGSWYDDAAYARSAYRAVHAPDDRFDDIGFRFARGH